MERSQKHAFWQALVLTFVVFNIGIFFVYMLEKNSADRIDKLYLNSELQLLDIRAQNDIYSLKNIDCESAVDENIKLADRIYEEAKVLQRYEDASRITDAMIMQHKKYDLLRTQVWINSIKLKQICNASYHNIVYLYIYANNEPPIEISARQNIFSKVLSNLKEEQGIKILLIPIPGDNNFSSINILKKIYNITELPAVLVDEKTKLTTIEEIKEIGKYLN